LVLTLCPTTYPTDENKVLFVISRLRGPPMSWARPIVENRNHVLRNNYTAFTTALSNMYLDQNYKDLCSAKLERLRQTKSAAAYSVEFATLIAPFPTMDDESKCRDFYRGLDDEIKDRMAIVGTAKTYDELVKQAIAIDQRNYQRRLERKSVTKAQPGPSNDQNKPHPSSSNNSRNNSSKPTPTSSNSTTHTPTTNSDTKRIESKPRGPLTEEEKARRERLGLCKYCADPKHKVNDCPRVPKDSTPKVNTISLPPPHYPQHSENSNAQAPTRTEA